MENIVKGDRVKLPTKYGFFNLIPFLDNETGLEHIALIKGDLEKNDIVLTRIHSACATGDLFGSLKCDCGEQLEKAMVIIEERGKGLLIYLQQEGRGIGLMSKIKAYKLQEEGLDTVDANLQLGFAADERKYDVAATILNLLGIQKVKLLTNNPTKISGLELYNIQVEERVPLLIKSNKYNKKYMTTKQVRMNHLYDVF